MGFGSGVVLHSKQVHDIRVSALSKRPRYACSKDKGRAAEVRSQESEVRSQESGVRSQELKQKHANEKVFVMS